MPKYTLAGFKKSMFNHLFFKKQQNYEKTNIGQQMS